MDVLEYRIRDAIRGEDQRLTDSDIFAVDTGETLHALANVVGELLALRDPADTEVFVELIRRQRSICAKQPHIMVQQTPAGHA